MLYAKQTVDGFHITVLSVFFPDTSFPATGPDAQWLAQSGVYPVDECLYFDADEFKRVGCDPVLRDGIVYTAELVALTEEEKAQRIADQEAAALAAQKEARAEAYRVESDPIFFKAQRGEATMDEWLAKVEEIKARYS
jgi:hypothetical protein